MIYTKYIILLIFAVLVVAWACTPISPTHKAAQAITESLSKNDLLGAENSAVKLDAEDVMSSSVSDLCAVSIALMRLSQSAADGGDYAAQALKYYTLALQKDSVAANRYFDMVGPEDYNSIHLLRQLHGQIQVREVESIIPEEEYEQQ